MVTSSKNPLISTPPLETSVRLDQELPERGLREIGGLAERVAKREEAAERGSQRKGGG